MTETILAVDLGGTHYRVGIATTADPAAVRSLGEWPSPTDRDSFLFILKSQMAAYGATRLGLAIPGFALGTTCRWVPNLAYLDGLDLAVHFPRVPIGLGNDAQFALLAETAADAASGLEDAILLAIGTGIGSAVLAGGRIVVGSTGAACSFGWAVADLHDAGENRSGWLERHASGRAIDARAAQRGFSSGKDLVQAARNGNDLAIESLAGPMRALGTALAGAVALLDPAVIILAGGVSSSFDVLAPLILATLKRQLPPHLRAIQIRAGHFGPGAGLVGAALAGARGPEWRNLHG